MQIGSDLIHKLAIKTARPSSDNNAQTQQQKYYEWPWTHFSYTFKTFTISLPGSIIFHQYLNQQRFILLVLIIMFIYSPSLQAPTLNPYLNHARLNSVLPNPIIIVRESTRLFAYFSSRYVVFLHHCILNLALPRDSQEPPLCPYHIENWCSSRFGWYFGDRDVAMLVTLRTCIFSSQENLFGKYCAAHPC